MTTFLSFCMGRMSFQKDNNTTKQHSENIHSTALTFIIYGSSPQPPLWSTHTRWIVLKKTSIFYLLNQKEDEAVANISIKYLIHNLRETQLNLVRILADRSNLSSGQTY